MTDYRALLEALSKEGVRYIVVGGAAATAHGSARLTLDLDLVYQRSAENIARLARALEGASPYLRGAPPGLPFHWDEPTIRRGLNFTLTTAWGALDLLGEITGGGSFEDLLLHTVTLNVHGIECPCLSLEWLIRVKRAAGRPKDLEAIAELEALLDEQESR